VWLAVVAVSGVAVRSGCAERAAMGARERGLGLPVSPYARCVARCLMWLWLLWLAVDVAVVARCCGCCGLLLMWLLWLAAVATVAVVDVVAVSGVAVRSV
jgi:hypothetical protein